MILLKTMVTPATYCSKNKKSRRLLYQIIGMISTFSTFFLFYFNQFILVRTQAHLYAVFDLSSPVGGGV